MGKITESLWQKTAARKSYAPLVENLDLDVAIIGAGITGLSTALLLKQAGLNVCVLEQYEVGSGESGMTTAHLTAILDTRYRELVSSFGKERARQVARSKFAAIDQIENWVREFSIECDFERVKGYLYSERKREKKELRKELDTIFSLGLDCQWEEDIGLPFETIGGISVSHQAQFHVLKYLNSIAARVHGENGAVYERTRVINLEDGDPCELSTSLGYRIRAKDVVIATDSPISNRFAMHTKVHSYRTYAIGIELEGEPRFRGLYWDTEDPYHYTRWHGSTLIVGGADHKVGMKKNTDESFLDLENYCQERYRVASVTYRWSGQVLNPSDGLPFIGRAPGMRRFHVGTGYGGNGMTFGTLSGMIFSDSILGRENEWSSLYRSNRVKPIAMVGEFVKENKDYPICMIKDRIASPEARSLDEVAPGEGKIVQVNHRKTAVYRDENDRIHAVSPVCTHMGCYVHFNQAERSWDCPCHGSRFSTDGQVLHGPAVQALKSVEIPEHERSREELRKDRSRRKEPRRKAA